MSRHGKLACALGLAAMLTAGVAWADHVFLLPAEGQVPGEALSATLAKETRLAIVELGHSLVPDEQVAAALAQVADGRADDADEFALLAQDTNAAWVVAPIIHAGAGTHRLEVTAYQTKTGRTESVSRDMDPNLIHRQVVEMAGVLLSEQGVGTAALPWEQGGTPPITPSSTAHAEAQPHGSVEADSKGLRPLVGVTVGVGSAISRPEGATGSATSIQGGLRAGVEFGVPIELALGLRGNFTGPKATGLDVSARYWVEVAEGFRLAPEVAPGLFFMGGGAQDTSFSLRFTAVGAVEVVSDVSVEAHVGDITWIPASGGTVVLGGATLAGVARF
jgi:hypothetical protein